MKYSDSHSCNRIDRIQWYEKINVEKKCCACFEFIVWRREKMCPMATLRSFSLEMKQKKNQKTKNKCFRLVKPYWIWFGESVDEEMGFVRFLKEKNHFNFSRPNSSVQIPCNFVFCFCLWNTCSCALRWIVNYEFSDS